MGYASFMLPGNYEILQINRNQMRKLDGKKKHTSIGRLLECSSGGVQRLLILNAKYIGKHKFCYVLFHELLHTQMKIHPCRRPRIMNKQDKDSLGTFALTCSREELICNIGAYVLCKRLGISKRKIIRKQIKEDIRGVVSFWKEGLKFSNNLVKDLLIECKYTALSRVSNLWSSPYIPGYKYFEINPRTLELREKTDAINSIINKECCSEYYDEKGRRVF